MPSATDASLAHTVNVERRATYHGGTRSAHSWATCSCGWELECTDVNTAENSGLAHKTMAGAGQSQLAGAPTHDPYVNVTKGGLYAAHCVCGWKNPVPFALKEDAHAAANDHVRGGEGEMRPHGFSRPAKSKKPSLFSLHQDGSCAVPCVYCAEERAERKRRRASEIYAVLDECRHQQIEAGGTTRPSMTYEMGVEAALAWVLRDEDGPDPLAE